VLKQEKNGFAALFLVFALLDFTGQFVKTAHHYNYVLYIVCLASVIVYCVLRYLKRKTQLLNEAGR
jgi:hypothetical protein